MTPQTRTLLRLRMMRCLQLMLFTRLSLLKNGETNIVNHIEDI